jgi:MFS family permease
VKYTLLVFLCSATVIAYIQRLGLAAPTKIIEEELQITPQTMGMIMAVWYWGYALMQLPSGWVADRLGSRVSLVIFALFWSVLTGLTGLVTGATGLLLVWGLMGCAQAGLFPCATKAIGSTFPKENQAFATGALSACMAMGSAISHWLSGRLLGPLTWEQILALYGCFGLIWAVVFALLVPRWEDRAPKEAPGKKQPIRWSKLFTDQQMLILCGQQFFRASAVALFYTWLPRYFRETHGLSEERAGELSSWPPLIGIAGGLCGGILSDWLLRKTGNYRWSRQGMAAIAMVICCILGLSAYLVTNTTLVVVLLCGVSFCAMGAGIGGYTLAISYGGKRVATVFATMNMSGNIGAGLFPLLVGWLVTQTGNWNLALLVFGIFFAASAVCYAFLNPQGTLFEESSEAST